MRAVLEVGEPFVEVAVEDREALGDAGLDRRLRDLDAAAAHVLLAHQLGEQLAVAAGEVEHRGAVGHQILDELVVDAAHDGYPTPPAQAGGANVRAPLVRKAPMTPSIFSRSSRKASWP